jgi:hypothetical protein
MWGASLGMVLVCVKLPLRIGTPLAEKVERIKTTDAIGL